MNQQTPDWALLAYRDPEGARAAVLRVQQTGNIMIASAVGLAAILTFVVASIINSGEGGVIWTGGYFLSWYLFRGGMKRRAAVAPLARALASLTPGGTVPRAAGFRAPGL